MLLEVNTTSTYAELMHRSEVRPYMNENLMFMNGRIGVLFMEIMFTTSTVTKFGKSRGMKMGRYLGLFNHLNSFVVFSKCKRTIFCFTKVNCNLFG
jgi:hypothetical protein